MSCFQQLWDGVQVKRSSDSFTIELLPSLGATINHSNKLQKFIISPYDPRYRYWELFLIVLVIYSAWVCPFELAFLRDLPSKLLLVENIVNSFFAIDIVLTFFVAYIDSKTHLLVDDRKRIAVRLEKDIRFNYFWTRCSKLISRDSIQAASEFAARNQLPEKIKQQMLSHFCLQFKTEGLNQQAMLNGLPKGIRSSIAYNLFFPIIRRAYLFHGVSNNFIAQLTLITTVNGNEKVYGKIEEGEVFGEKLKLQENLPGFMHKYETFHVPREAWLLPQPYLQYKEHRCEDTSKKVPTFGADNGSTKLVAESNQLRKPQQENSHDQSNCNCGATDGMAGKEEDHDEVHINCEARKGTEELCIQIKSEHCDTASSWHTNHETVKLASYHNTSEGITRRRNQDNNYIKASNKRVTVHAYAYNATGSLVQNGKLISLPGSLEELFEIGSQKFPGFHPTKVFSRDYAEIDDISVIRDGDHLLLQM
ncbi:hypothetical protein HU200_067249 [Digitaria exilis]|uniref:KHA domain-containing protein n=1 Tax=Digitaria exilis TaxID=1010633 RepID=A0A835DTC5_9POAL|nr:hypothetical protein HU200_067249 [Digitaria exilis]